MSFRSHQLMKTYLDSSANNENYSDDGTPIAILRIRHANHEILRYLIKFQYTGSGGCNMEGCQLSVQNGPACKSCNPIDQLRQKRVSDSFFEK